jgi:hypothetical protein
MAKKDLSYKYDTCECGTRKLKRSAKCLACNRKIGNKYGVKPYEIKSVDGKCLVCKFDLFPKQKAFCSAACRYTHRRIPERDCLCCGKMFKPKASKARYCTNECGNKHKSVTYRSPDSKTQQNKVTVCGVRIGQSSKLNFAGCANCKSLSVTFRPIKLKFCSQKCKNKYVYKEQVSKGWRRKPIAGWAECLYCGERKWHDKHANKTFCSKACTRKHKNRVQELRLKNNVKDRGVTLPNLIKRVGWACNCCGVKCQMPIGFNFADEATIDHVVPVSKGGTHTWDNVQLLCRKCNSNKRDTDWQVFKNRALTN